MLNFLNNNTNNDLNHEQYTAYKMAIEGRSMFIMGQGGTGKSYLIDKIYNRLVQIHGFIKVAKTSTTGISAVNINGRTIHSWAGIGLGAESVDDLITAMYPTSREKWSKVKTIIIDEISMLNPDILDKLYAIGRRLNKEPIQYILVGDPFQLPVVKSTKLCHDAVCWRSIVGPRTVILYQNFRQADPVYRKLLNQVRLGICTKNTSDILNSRIGADISNEYGITPTVLYPKNKEALDKNNIELEKLKREGARSVVYNAQYVCKYNTSKQKTEKLIADFQKNSNLEDKIELCVGAQIMFKKNMTDLDIVNGTRGIVTGFEVIANKVLPIVTLLNGITLTVTLQEFKYSVKNEFEIIKTQIPLKLAWATTIHSSQGSELDLVLADIGSSIFDYGQAYVVLSRVKTLAGLSLISFKESSIIVNTKLLEKYYSDIIYVKKLPLCDDIISVCMDYLI